MSPQRYPPAYLRYLRARLWNLGRPAFWGTAIFLSVLGLGIGEYWANPDLLTFLQKNKQPAAQKPPDSSLSDEDRAIAADIDNLPVLINDAQQSKLLIAPSIRKEKSQDNESKSLLDDLISKQQEAAKNAKSNPVGIVNNLPAAKVTNPFVAQAESLLQAGTGSQLFGVKSSNTSSVQPGIAGSSSNLGIGSANQINNNQNPAPISALQTAINESTQKPSSLNNTTFNQTNTIERSLPSNDLPNQDFSTNTQLNTNPKAPISTTQPTLTNQPQNLYTNSSQLGTSYTQPIVTNQPPNYYGNFNNIQPLPSVVTPTSTVSPGTYTAPNNIAPYSPQAPNQGTVQPSNQVGYGNGNLNPSLLQTKSPQSNLTVPPLSAGQYGGVNINGYTYP
jgi:hypothetical protein